MKAVCLDTNVLIWGIKGEAELGQEHMIPRAKAFLKHLDENQIPAVIPTIVLAEFLARSDSSKHAEITQKLEKSFLIIPFDTRSSSKFSDLWKTKNGIRKDQPICTRDHMKADLLIVASALSSGVKSICSSDPHVKKAADGMVPCTDLPEFADQLHLGLESEDEPE